MPPTRSRLDIDPLPAVTNPEEAAQPGAPLLYPDVPDNIALDYHYGDSAHGGGGLRAGRACHRLKLVNNRVVVNAMEPRAAMALYEQRAAFTLHVPSQGVFGMRGNVAQVLGVEPGQVHVITGNIGGSFGMKATVYAEYVCALHAARALGRPVKWADERSGSFVSDSHGRDHRVTAELALDADGHFLAVRLTSFSNMGALPGQCRADALDAQRGQERAERLSHAVDRGLHQVRVHQYQPVSAYRGAGRPEGNYYMERLIDAAAGRAARSTAWSCAGATRSSAATSPTRPPPA